MLQMAVNRVLPSPPPPHCTPTPPPLPYSTCNTKRSPLALIAEWCQIDFCPSTLAARSELNCTARRLRAV